MGNIRYGMAAAFVTGMALFAVGCTGGGGDSGKDNSAQGSGGSGDGKAEDDAYKHRQCLRDNGLKIDEPKDGQLPGIQGGDSKAMKKAMEACKHLPGAGGGKEMSQEEKQKALDKAVKYAQCMRKNGVDMPDPKMDEDGSLTAQRGDVSDASKEKMEKAMKACSDQNGE